MRHEGLSGSGSGFDSSPEVPHLFVRHAGQLPLFVFPQIHSAVLLFGPEVLGTAVEVFPAFVHQCLLCVEAGRYLYRTPILSSVDWTKPAFLLLSECFEHHSKPCGMLFWSGLISSY